MGGFLYGGFHKCWYPNSWMVDFMEHPKIKIDDDFGETPSEEISIQFGVNYKIALTWKDGINSYPKSYPSYGSYDSYGSKLNSLIIGCKQKSSIDEYTRVIDFNHHPHISPSYMVYISIIIHRNPIKSHSNPIKSYEIPLRSH